ncbi:hypothetical protein DERF_010431 [Dermatophagoides farinae]|uniref:Uncharacterized protein n=1 Tax=Dermatophagoides farinae TaxID=6954 RepID=A0A922HVW6_DERFA|nr:hypothetical protein DERF_010431 [Dermatophagoides farinae]
MHNTYTLTTTKIIIKPTTITTILPIIETTTTTAATATTITDKSSTEMTIKNQTETTTFQTIIKDDSFDISHPSFYLFIVHAFNEKDAGPSFIEITARTFTHHK